MNNTMLMTHPLSPLAAYMLMVVMLTTCAPEPAHADLISDTYQVTHGQPLPGVPS